MAEIVLWINLGLESEYLSLSWIIPTNEVASRPDVVAVQHQHSRQQRQECHYSEVDKLRKVREIEFICDPLLGVSHRDSTPLFPPDLIRTIRDYRRRDFALVDGHRNLIVARERPFNLILPSRECDVPRCNREASRRFNPDQQVRRVVGRVDDLGSDIDLADRRRVRRVRWLFDAVPADESVDLEVLCPERFCTPNREPIRRRERLRTVDPNLRRERRPVGRASGRVNSRIRRIRRFERRYELPAVGTLILDAVDRDLWAFRGSDSVGFEWSYWGRRVLRPVFPAGR